MTIATSHPVEAALAAIDRGALLPLLPHDQARLLAGPVARAAAGVVLDEPARVSATLVMHANRALLGPPLAQMGATIPEPGAEPPRAPSSAKASQRITIKAINIGGQVRIGAFGPYLKPLLESLPGARWSGTRGCWHVPGSPAGAHEILAVLGVQDPLVSAGVRSLAQEYTETNSARAVLVDGGPLPDGDLSDVVNVPGWEHQLRGVAFTEAARALLLAVPMGGGKCLRLTTPIATPTGWTTMGELREGDELFDERGEICRVTTAHPIQHGLPCYEVEFSDGEVLVASGDHRWFTETRSDRERQGYHRGRGTVAPTMGAVRTTEEIRATLRVGARDLTNHSVPVARPLALPDAELPVPPYVLGVWLGDGSSRCGTITTADGADMRELLAAEGYRCGPNLAAPDRTEMFTAYGLLVQLRALGVLQAKAIPDAYLRASEKQRRALLAGLLDTDGTVCGHGRIQFDSTRETLARGALELALSLGYRATITDKAATFDGRVVGRVWRVSFTTADPVFRLPRKQRAHEQRCANYTASRNLTRFIVDVRPVPSEPVRCVAVDSGSHLFLAGRAMIPTHNTITTIAGLNRVQAATVLVVCPNQVRAVWPREAREKSAVSWHCEDGTRPAKRAGGRRVDLSAGERLERMQRVLWGCDCGAPVHAFCINYEALATPVWRKWRPPHLLDAIVYDEIHRLKSPTGQVSKVAGKWHGYARRHIGLSGTPLPQTPLDAFGVMRALDPGIYGTTWTGFKNRYAVMDPTGTFPLTGRINNAAELATKFMSITYRPEIDLKLPPVTDVTYEVDLEPAARKAYDDLDEALWADLTEFDAATVTQAIEAADAVEESGGPPSEITTPNMLTKLLRLQQLTGGTLRDDEGVLRVVSTAKRDRVATWLEDEVVLRRKSGDPVVMFCRFHHDLDVAAELAEKFGVRYGEISGRAKTGLDDDARMHPDVDVVGVQIQSGGTGIDLTRARYAGWYSLGYSVSLYDQARKRLDRPGQTRPVLMAHFLARDTADQAVYDAIDQRRAVISEVLRQAGVDPASLGVYEPAPPPLVSPDGKRLDGAVRLPWDD